MTQIRNVSPYGDLDVPLLGRVVEAGETVDVDEAHAAVLLLQAENFVAAEPAADPPAEPAPADLPATDQPPIETPAPPANPETEQS